MCLLYNITQYRIYRAKNNSGRLNESNPATLRNVFCAISREHYRGYEINRCEKDQIRKRRSRYGDSGIIAHGGYVELSREIRTRGVRIWGRHEVMGEPQRCVWEQLNLWWRRSRIRLSYPFLYTGENFPMRNPGWLATVKRRLATPEAPLTTPLTADHICLTERQYNEVIFLRAARIVNFRVECAHLQPYSEI